MALKRRRIKQTISLEERLAAEASRLREAAKGAVPEGWTAEVLDVALTAEQRRTFGELNLEPGDVHRLDK
jgi:hypothetical protein